MRIRHVASDRNQAVAIKQSASSGGDYAQPVKLSAIRIDVKDAEAVLREIIRSCVCLEKKFGQVRSPRREAQSEAPAVSEAHYQRVRL